MSLSTEDPHVFFRRELNEAHARLLPHFSEVGAIQDEHLEYVATHVLLRFVSSEAFNALYTRTPVFDWVSAMSEIPQPANRKIEEFAAYCMFQVGIFPLAGFDEITVPAGKLRRAVIKKGVPMKHYVESGISAYHKLGKEGKSYLFGTLSKYFTEIAVIISSLTLKRIPPLQNYELYEYWKITKNPFALDRLLEQKILLPLV